MAHNESTAPPARRMPEKLNPKVSASPVPKTASKRSATAVSEGQWPAGSSTPASSRKKPFLEPGGGTPLSAVSMNVSNLDHSGSSTSRYQRTLTMRITRGIQTIAPQTANRYCTARIPKRTASVPVQTDNVFVLSSPPEKTLLTDATCQTAEPAVQEACIGTSQQQVVPPSPCVDGWCQTILPPEDQSITVHTTSTAKRNSSNNATTESTASSFTTGLSNIIQMYDCDAVADDKQTEDNAKRSKRRGKQTARDQQQQQQQQHLLPETFVNETSKTIATKLDKKMSTILERHLATCNRSMARDRMKFMQWMKSYHTRQRQLEAKAAARSQMARRVLVVRKRAAPVGVPRPAVTEQSIQCDLPIVLPPEQPPKAAAVTVGTQWTRQRQTVTNAARKRAQTRSTGTQFSSKISTDPLPATGKTTITTTTRKGPMRQTKLHSYAEGGKDHPQQQAPPPRRQQQQRKCSPKLAVKEASSPPVPPALKNPSAKKKPPPPPKQGADSKNSKPKKEPSPEINIEETPSEPSDTEVVERKHFPYRTQKPYPSQCSKSTETTFLTPTKVRDILPEPSDAMGGQPLRHVCCETMSPQPNQSQLLSPMERMYVGRQEPPPLLPRTVERSNYGPFLVPLGGATGGQDEAISQTPPNIVYVNRPERRMLVRSNVPTVGNNNNNTTVRGTGLVREKYPEVSIISSQQLCSQIGLAVEKALKNKTIPPLESMYGKPFIEVFNGVDSAVEDNDGEEDKRHVTDGGGRRAGFVCSSANDELGQQQANRTVAPPPPPFRNDRSPSLSPIVYRGDDSEDDFL